MGGNQCVAHDIGVYGQIGADLTKTKYKYRYHDHHREILLDVTIAFENHVIIEKLQYWNNQK